MSGGPIRFIRGQWKEETRERAKDFGQSKKKHIVQIVKFTTNSERGKILNRKELQGRTPQSRGKKELRGNDIRKNEKESL